MRPIVVVTESENAHNVQEAQAADWDAAVSNRILTSRSPDESRVTVTGFLLQYDSDGNHIVI